MWEVFDVNRDCFMFMKMDSFMRYRMQQTSWCFFERTYQNLHSQSFHSGITITTNISCNVCGISDIFIHSY